MTENTNRSTTNPDLPDLEGNVIDPSGINGKHLKKLLDHFASGDIQPLILGENGEPQAAVIPFEAFRRLVKYDTEHIQQAEAAFAQEIRGSLDDIETNGPAAVLETEADFEAWVASLGDAGKQWLAENRPERRE